MASNEIGLTFELKILYHLLVWITSQCKVHTYFHLKAKVCWSFNKKCILKYVHF